MMRSGQQTPRSARIALLLCAASVAGLALVRTAISAFSIVGLPAVLLQATGLVLFALAPSVLGLLVLEGDQTRIVRFQTLNTAQIALYTAAGVLAVFPAALLGGLLEVIAQSFVSAISSAIATLTASGAVAGAGLRTAVFAGFAPGLTARLASSAAAGSPGASLFLPMLLCHALLAPAGEELFFRGYLLGVWERGGQKTAAVAVALLFALAHGLGVMTPVYLLLGLLFALLAQRADSVLAPMLAHAGYNAALVSLEFLGVGAMLDVRSLPGCAVLLLGSAAFAAVLFRALALRGGVRRARLWDGRGLSRREIALLAGAALALVASLIVGGVLG